MAAGQFRRSTQLLFAVSDFPSICSRLGLLLFRTIRKPRYRGVQFQESFKQGSMSADDLGQELAEKLAKLNSSQQSIESLSRWCITHRTKVKLIVETWDKVFRSAQREQRVSLLYLANDILQNSRRKGSDFVNEFWKFLPAALKLVCENGDESGKKVASRLIGIWEDRKVFGSRGQNLKEEVLGKSNPTPVSISGKNPNPAIKVMKRDAQSLRIKLAVGGLPEKIMSAFQLVLDENVSEESAVKKCDFAISFVNDLEKDVENSSISGNGFELVDKIQEEEDSLRQCVDQLQNIESIRTALVSQLKEALQDQESKLEMIRSKVEIAKSQIENVEYLKEKLKSSAPLSMAAKPVITALKSADVKYSNAQLTSSPRQRPSTTKLSEEESKKAAAAAVVAKLAASTSSAQMLTSVLSSLVAEEAASRSTGLNIPGFSFNSPAKRIKLDNPVSESSSSHSFSQPPLPPPQQNSPATQVGQSTAMMMASHPYGYNATNLPPPHVQMGYARPTSLPTQQLQHLQPPQQPQQPPLPLNGSYYRPPGVGFYGQSHQQAATSPVQRQ